VDWQSEKSNQLISRESFSTGPTPFFFLSLKYKKGKSKF
jgi:hypothetical protein